MIKPGIYRHFKGEDKRYQVIGTAMHSETGESMVVYRALYGEGALFVRPEAMFLEEVDKPEYNYRGPRFIFVSDI